MKYLTTNGYCPECELKGEKTELLLNSGDIFECPKSRLQLVKCAANMAVILRWRGKGEFRKTVTKGTDYLKGLILTKAKDEPMTIISERTAFHDKQELAEYLLGVG